MSFTGCHCCAAKPSSTFPHHRAAYYPDCDYCILSQTPMATPHPKYQYIFDEALVSYKKRTGKDLASDPLLGRFETCRSPDEVFAIFRELILGSDQSRSSSGKLKKWLDPTVNVLYTLSATIGQGLVSRSEIQDLLFDIGLIAMRSCDRDFRRHWGPPFSEHLLRFLCTLMITSNRSGC